MIEPIAEVLKAIKKNTFDKGKFRWRKGYIFPEVTKNSGTNLLKAFKKSQEALKISPIRVIHHLRHSFSTIIQEVAGLDISEAQLLLRHKTLTMTHHYTHRQAIKLWPKVEEFDLHLRDLKKK